MLIEKGVSIIKKYKLYSIFCIFIFIFSMFLGCDSEENHSQKRSGSTGVTWTVLIYMCGTDLESEGGAASSNLEELMEISNNKNINFVIETGGTANWQSNSISNGKIQRYILKDSELSLVEEKDLSSMGDPSTLGDFLKWGVKTYPADKYMTVFWNHGGGSVAGVEFDELHNNDSLSLKELAKGLEMSGAKFEVIGFDACLMATLENAATIAPYGKYMVASEEYEPGGGWDYKSWGEYLSENPACDGSELGKNICDSYIEKCAITSDDHMATLSVVDLSKIEKLKGSFDNMAKEMTGITQDINQFNAFSRAAVKAENYGGNTDSEGYTNMVDLGDLVKETESVLDETSATMLNSLKDTVLYEVKGESRKNANGLSVFYPLNADNNEYNKYAEIATSKNYLAFLNSLSPNWTAPADVETEKPENSVKPNDHSINFTTNISADGNYSLKVNSGLDAIQSVKFNLFYMDTDYNEYMFMGVDNDINSDYEKGEFYDNFRGVWTTINGYYCELNLVDEEEDYNLYSIPILLNGKEMNLRVAYVFDNDETGHFEIYGAWEGIDSESGMSAKDIVKIKDGDKITLLFDSYNADNDESNIYETDTFTVSGPLVIEESELFDGDYMYSYEVTDIFGNVKDSDSVIMTCENGEIFVSETEEQFTDIKFVTVANLVTVTNFICCFSFDEKQNLNKFV
ncbi:MAG: clostripain-related cysteine peptidase [Clostridium sp.]|nr:clostripain-related cysteine peptidase [Clostridium sp.]